MSGISFLGKPLAVLAVVLLFHAAYSTYEHLSIMKALGKPATEVPSSIRYEAIISFLMFVPAVALATSKLEDITWRGEMNKRISEDTDARMAFLPFGPAARATPPKSQI